MSSEPRRAVKGTMFVHSRRYLLEHRGEATLRRIVAALPPADRAIVDGLILTSGWYPVGAWNRFVRTATDLLPDAPHIVLDIARYIASEDMNLLFKLVLKMASAEAVLRRAGSIYGRYFSMGELAAEPRAERRWGMYLTAPVHEEEGPSVHICLEGVPGWLLEALQLCGAKGARVTKERCRFDRAPRCEYEVTW